MRTNAQQIIANKQLRLQWSFVYYPNGKSFYEKGNQKVKPEHFDLTFPLKVIAIENIK